jgi:hypothetical protein
VDEKISYDKYLDDLVNTIKDKKTKFFYKSEFKSLFFNKIRHMRNYDISKNTINKNRKINLNKKQNLSFIVAAINNISYRKKILKELLTVDLFEKIEIELIKNLMKSDVINLERSKVLSQITNENYRKLLEKAMNSLIYELFPYSSPSFDPQKSYEEVLKSLKNLNTRLLNLKKINKSLSNFVNESNSLNWNELQSIHIEILDEE